MTIGGLGSGLDFLYDENATEVQVKKTLRVSELEPNRTSPANSSAMKPFRHWRILFSSTA